MNQPLIDALREAFGEVTRIGGRSWTDSRMLDLMSTPGEEPPPAHREDDRSWVEVSDDPGWDPDAAIGGWAFLDGIGFRYYLAAALLRALRGDVASGLASQVTPPFKPSHRAKFLARWLLDARQQAVLLRIAAHLRDAAFASNDAGTFDEWTHVLERWHDEPDAPS